MDETGSLTPEGNRQARAAAGILARAQETSQRPRTQEPKSESHTRRWASYSNLSGSFDLKPSAGERTKEPQHPLDSDKASDQSQPLLALFEQELARLVKPAVEDEAPGNLNHRAEEQNKKEAATSTSTRVEVPDPVPGTSHRPHPNAADVGDAVDSLFGGITQMVNSALPIASRITGRELSIPPHITEAQQKLSENLSRTLHDLDSGIESLRNRLDERASARSGPQTRSAAPFEDSLPEVAPETTEAPDGSSPETQEHSTKPEADEKTSTKTHGRQFKASKIVGRRYIQYNDLAGPRKLQYLVRWDGHGPDEDVWYDAENLGQLSHLLNRYIREHPERRAHLMSWSSQEYADAEELHSRTAGDRMITHKSWRGEPAAASNKSDLQLNHGLAELVPGSYTADQHLPNLRGKVAGTGPRGPHATTTTKSDVTMIQDQIEEEALAWGQGRSIPEDALHGSLPRPSWHRHSANAMDNTRGFQFSPSAIMAKYPPVSSLERAAHHGISPPTSFGPDRKAVYIQPNTNLPYKGLRHDIHPEPKEKSVRFSEADPWQEKDKAQKAWRVASYSPSKDWETEKTQNVPAQNPTTQPISTSSSANKCVQASAKNEAVNDSVQVGLRRAKSLAFDGRQVQPPVTVTKPDENVTKRGKHRSLMSLNEKYLKDASMPKDKFGRVVYDDPTSGTAAPIRRATTISNHFSRSSKGATGVAQPRAGPRAPAVSSQNLIDLHDASGTELNHKGQAPNPDRNTVGTASGSGKEEVDTATKQPRHLVIEKCIDQLSEMGFPRSKARTVAESVDGVLETALDVLDEDRRASQAFWGNRNGGSAREGSSRGWENALWMPGAW